ncbi:hypothetical protein GCM10020255_066760 [Rhodococcus baikonurensis]
MSRIGNVIDQLVETGREVGPALGTIVTSLSKASAALGVSTWQVFLSTLDASAQILNSTLVPVLNVTAGLMQNNQGAVVALAAAFLAFKTIPALIGRISGAITLSEPRHPPLPDECRDSSLQHAMSSLRPVEWLRQAALDLCLWGASAPRSQPSDSTHRSLLVCRPLS